MRIRIGNDIKLRLQLVVDGDEPANILSAEAFIINNTAKLLAIKDLENKTRFLTRFPAGSQVVDPKLNGLQPSQYNINMLGEVSYNTYPTVHACGKYCGVGLNPNWDKKYMPIANNYDVASYKADVAFTEDRNIVEVSFPASAQLYTGDYSVVMVSKIYKPGYGNNAATVTVDYSDLFTLVGENEAGETGAILIESAQTNTSEPQVNPSNPQHAPSVQPSDIYVTSASYEDGTLSLHRSDNFDIDVEVDGGRNIWYE